MKHLACLALLMAAAPARADDQSSLPPALQSVVSAFEAAVTPEADQGEFTFTLEHLPLDYADDRVVETVTKRELTRLTTGEGPILNDFRVRKLWGGEAGNVETLLQAVGVSNANGVAFFCGALKDEAAHGNLAKCRDVTRTILETVASLDAVVVQVDGEWYGDYREVVVYVPYAGNALRLHFDVVHEI